MPNALNRLAVPTAILALNLLVFVSAPGYAAPALAALGSLSAVFIPRGPVPRLTWLAALLMLLPIAGWSAEIGFLRVDARVQLSAAWVALLAILLVNGNHSGARSTRGTAGPVATFPRAAILFIAWSSVLWLIAIWDVGIGRLVPLDRNAVPSNCGGDILAWVFGAWDSHSVRDHLYLPWRTPADYASQTVYVNHSQAYLLGMYVAVKSIQAVTGQPLHYAINLTPFVYMAVAVCATATLLARSGLFSERLRLPTLAWIFVLLGVLLTQWRFWRDLYTFTADDPFPLIGAVLVLLIAAFRQPVTPTGAVIVAALLGALNPFTAPAVLLALICLHANSPESPGLRPLLEKNRLLARSAAALSVGAVLFFLLPRLLIVWAGYNATGSSFLFRSGLDGDSRFVSSVWQAIISPCTTRCCGGGRTLRDFILPAFVPLGFAGLLARHTAEPVREFGRLLAFVATPYMLSVILFAQAVSVHPYFYDHLLLMPVTIIGVGAMLHPVVQQRLRGAVLLWALLMFAGIIMSNFMAIAQAFPR